MYLSLVPLILLYTDSPADAEVRGASPDPQGNVRPGTVPERQVRFGVGEDETDEKAKRQEKYRQETSMLKLSQT